MPCRFGIVTHHVLQEGLSSNVEPGHGAGVDESAVSVVNRGASEPLAGVVAKERVAYDPLGGIVAAAVLGILHRHGFQDVGDGIFLLVARE